MASSMVGVRETSGFQRFFKRVQSQKFWIFLLLVVATTVLMPIVSLFVLAVDDNFAGIRQMWQQPRLLSVLGNTVFLALGALVVAMASGAAVAFSVWVLPPNWRKYTNFLPVLPLLIPSVAHVIGFVFLFSPENGYINTFLRMTPFFSEAHSGPFNIYTIWGIVFYTGFSLSSYVYLFVFTGLQDMGTDYVQAARANGASPVRTFFSITLPMLRPVFVYSAMIVMLLSLGQFTGPLLLGRRLGIEVVTTQLYLATTEAPINYSMGAAYAIPLMGMAALILWAQHRVLGNKDRFVGRGHTSVAQLPASMGVKLTALTIIVLSALISAILPLLALVFVALTPFWSGEINFAMMTTRNIEYVLNNPMLMQSVWTTLRLSALALVILIPVGMMVAMAIFYRNLLWKPLSVAMDTIANLPLAIPSSLMGFGFLFAYTALPLGLYGTAAGMVLAFIIVKLPFAVRYQLSSLIALGSTQVEAARANGAGPLRTFFQIILPLAQSGVAAAAAVIFVLLLHEFGVSVMLRSVDINVMSVVLFDLFHNGGLYPQVAAMALLMTFITMIGVVVALWLGGTKAFAKS